MKTTTFIRTALILAVAAGLVGFIVSIQSQVSPPEPRTAAEQISRGMYFGQRIVPVGEQPAETDAQLLLVLLNVAAINNYRTGLEDLEVFLNIYSNSPWAPSLDAVLGRHYFEMGRYTPALEHWELAWEATKHYPSGNGKEVADFALASWTRLLASLGRLETLTNLMAECHGRVLDRGSLSQKWARTREAIGDMQLRPSASYRCGSFALNAVARELGRPYDVVALINTPSPATGFSLAALAELSVRFGVGLFPVARTAGGEIPVPSVVHWQQNHYAAIISRRGNLYKVVDPTFGHPRYMTAETINAEASGYFLTPANQVTPNFRWLGPEETGLIYGRGNPNFMTDGDDQICDECQCPTGPGGGDSDSGGQLAGEQLARSDCGSACKGMPVWRVSEPYINVWLEDEPLSYQPALGQRMALRLTYKQRSENEHRPELWFFSNLGRSWHSSWFSMVRHDTSGNVALNYSKGGEAMFYQGDLEGSSGVGNYYNNLKFRAVTNGAGFCTGYELVYPDGAKDVYGILSTNLFYGQYWYHYLSQKISPEGFTTSFYYDLDPGGYKVRLKHVVDADGKTNTLYYYSGPYYYDTLVTQISDPYGCSVYFEYDYPSALLTNIVDSAGLGSTLTYNEYGWPTNLTTPYGPTTFDYIDLGIIPNMAHAYAWYRQVGITQPNNGKQLYLFIQNVYEETRYGVREYPSAQVPTNTPIGTLNNTNLWARNSFHWGPLQYPTLSTTDTYYMTTNDFLRARMRHWLGDVPNHEYQNKMDTLSLERTYSPDGVVEGQKTWYDYPNKGPYGTGDQGTHILPGVTARVLPDGSTWYQWKRRNYWGSPTNVVETYTQPNGNIGLRTNHFVYAANGLDLVLHTGPHGEQVVSNYYGNAYHQVDASYDALNQETKYSYNANRQMTSIVRPNGLTTTNLFFSSGSAEDRLEKTIDLEINRTNSFTYSGDLVYSHTDERGLTVTNYWDGLSRFTGRKYPDGTTTSNIYTALDITATKDRMGYWSYSSYNGIRQKVAETNANGVVTGYGLCDCGAVMSVTNAWNTPAQLVTSFGYDLQGNRLYTYHPDATVTNWYDSLQRVIVTGDAWGYRWFGYNNQGLLTSISNAFGAEQFTVHDVDDHPIYVTDANGVTVTNTYDELHRLLTRTYPDTGVEKFGYSARGLVAYTNQLGYTNFYAYDEAGRKRFETNANWELIRYTNNAAGDLLALVDGKNQVTKWKYDEYGRVTNKLDQAGTEILRYKYDPNSRLTNRWSTAKGDTKYKYDPVGNLTNVDYAVSTDVSLQYDPLNRVTNMVDAAGTTVYTYAVGGQLWTEDGPLTSDTVTNVYTSRLRTGLRLQQPTGTWTNAFAYDAARRLTNVTSPAGAFGYLLPSTRPTYLASRITLPNTSYITNVYDGNARLLSTTLKNSSHSALNAHTYGYNAGNQRTQQSFSPSGSTYDYTYDKIGQLKVADSATASEDRSYVYDRAWNLTNRTVNTTPQTFTVDGKNQLTSSPDFGHSYDGNGNLTEALYFGSNPYYAYEYDDENQLIRIGRFDYTLDAPLWRSRFVYDGTGRLRVREEWTFNWSSEYEWDRSETSLAWELTAETRYTYDGWRVIQERDGGNTPTVSYTRGTDLSGTLEGAGGIGGMLARSHDHSSGNWSTHNSYHADGNGNITYLVNSSQTVAANYRYDPYGNMLSSSGSLAAANTYRFSSKMIHDSSGLYYYGYRWYDPNLQRWLNRDPIEEKGGINLYGFVRNEPTRFFDPLGEQLTNGPFTINTEKPEVPPFGSGPILPYPPIPTWPPANPWPTNPISVDAGKGGVTIHTGNGPPVRPGRGPRPCSPIGSVTPSRPGPPVTKECPCTGTVEIPCTEHDVCVFWSMGLNGQTQGTWVTVPDDCPCPEHAH